MNPDLSVPYKPKLDYTQAIPIHWRNKKTGVRVDVVRQLRIMNEQSRIQVIYIDPDVGMEFSEDRDTFIKEHEPIRARSRTGKGK